MVNDGLLSNKLFNYHLSNKQTKVLHQFLRLIGLRHIPDHVTLLILLNSEIDILVVLHS